jgi:hypothetical protein
VRFSSAAAAAKLEVRAADSKARSQLKVGNPTTGRIVVMASQQKFEAKGTKLLACRAIRDQFIVVFNPELRLSRKP